MTSEYRLSLPMLEPDTAPADAKAVLERAHAQVGFLPNMYRGMANVPAVLETYLLGYDGIRASDTLSSAEQEVVFLTISRSNACGYCMSAHSMLADTVSQVPRDVLEALRNDEPVNDPRLDALSRFTRVMLDSRGRPSAREVQAFLDAGFEEKTILEIILAIAVKTLSNYSNHLFHTEVDDMFGDYRWKG